MSRTGSVSASERFPECIRRTDVEPLRIDLLSRNSSCQGHPGARIPASIKSGAPVTCGDTVDHPLVVCSSSRLEGIGGSTRAYGIPGIYQRAAEAPLRVQKCDAELLRPRRSETRPREKVWDVPGNGNGCSSFPRTRTDNRLESD